MRIALRISLVAAVLALVAAAPAAVAGKPGGGGSRGCTAGAPGVAVDNNWSWSGLGSWGLPGQQLTYAIAVRNYDVGCGSSSFVVTVSAPDGFSVSLPADTITLKSYSTGYLWAHVTSPSSVADGDYPLTVTVRRSGESNQSASTRTYYKVYSSDTVAPTLFWPNPAEGQTVTGRSYDIVVSSSDDHAVRKVDLYLDGAYLATTMCDNISYTCQLSYKASATVGQHTATFKAYDWLGNSTVLTVKFTVASK
jgi:hypothetical protein